MLERSKMASVTIAVTEDLRGELKQLSWINWSEVAREEALKKLIFENYMKTGTLTDNEWEFCDKIDWHPVDELPLKEEFVKRLESARKEKSIKLRSINDLFK